MWEAGRGSLRFQASFGEAAWNKIRRDSSEMNLGWSLAPANQITTKRQRSMRGGGVLESASEKLRAGNSTSGAAKTQRARGKMCLIGDERAPEFPRRAAPLIAFVRSAPAGVSRANAN